MRYSWPSLIDGSEIQEGNGVVTGTVLEYVSYETVLFKKISQKYIWTNHLGSWPRTKLQDSLKENIS